MRVSAMVQWKGHTHDTNARAKSNALAPRFRCIGHGCGGDDVRQLVDHSVARVSDTGGRRRQHVRLYRERSCDQHRCEPHGHRRHFVRGSVSGLRGRQRSGHRVLVVADRQCARNDERRRFDRRRLGLSGQRHDRRSDRVDRPGARRLGIRASRTAPTDGRWRTTASIWVSRHSARARRSTPVRIHRRYRTRTTTFPPTPAL